jgi:hypothetical protein
MNSAFYEFINTSMSKKSYQFFFKLLAVDFNLLNISFFAMNYWKRGTFVLSPMYLKLLIAFYIIWLFVSLLIKKFHFGSYTGYWDVILLFTKSAIFNAFSLSFMVVLMGLPAFSRLHIFGTFVLLFLMNIAIFSIYYASTGKAKIAHLKKEQIEPKEKPRISIFLSLGDFLLVAILFFVINYFKRGTFVLSPDYEKLLLVIYSVWFVTAFITGKFDKRNFVNYYYALCHSIVRKGHRFNDCHYVCPYLCLQIVLFFAGADFWHISHANGGRGGPLLYVFHLP